MRRKHHCRFCGELVCKECSDEKLMPASGYDEALRCCRKCIIRNEENQAEQSVGGRVRNMFGKVGDGFKTFGSKIKNPFAKNNDNNRGGGDVESGYAERTTTTTTTPTSAWANRNPFARKPQPEQNDYAAAAA